METGPEAIRREISQMIADAEFPTYVYSYPSKRAYRTFDPPPQATSLWSSESGPLNLYVHIPFCAYHCTFCTLFTTTGTADELRSAYVDSLCRQIREFSRVCGGREVVSLYVGGGTPTVLADAQLEMLFQTLRNAFSHWRRDAEISVEGAPDTMTPHKVQLLLSLGVNRISMGLQTLVPEELKVTGRPYPMDAAYQAIETVRSSGVQNFNFDLIYGLQGQSLDSWLYSVENMLRYEPPTVTLYPAVYRPLSGAARVKAARPGQFVDNVTRYRFYDCIVESLLNRSYRQESFVRFTRSSSAGYSQENHDFLGVPLLGFGAGARSYAGAVHYSTDYAVGKPSTMQIIDEFIDGAKRDLFEARVGCWLDESEQQRRFVVLNLLLSQLDLRSFAERFGATALEGVESYFRALEAEGCISIDNGRRVRLTRKGYKYSNIVAAVLTSAKTRRLEDTYQPQ